MRIQDGKAFCRECKKVVPVKEIPNKHLGVGRFCNEPIYECGICGFEGQVHPIDGKAKLVKPLGV